MKPGEFKVVINAVHKLLKLEWDVSADEACFLLLPVSLSADTYEGYVLWWRECYPVAIGCSLLLSRVTEAYCLVSKTCKF